MGRLILWGRGFLWKLLIENRSYVWSFLRYADTRDTMPGSYRDIDTGFVTEFPRCSDHIFGLTFLY